MKNPELRFNRENMIFSTKLEEHLNNMYDTNTTSTGYDSYFIFKNLYSLITELTMPYIYNYL